MWPCILDMYMELLRKYFNYNKHAPEEFSIKCYNFIMRCSIVPRMTQNELPIKPFYCTIYFLDTEANAMFKTESK